MLTICTCNVHAPPACTSYVFYMSIIWIYVFYMSIICMVNIHLHMMHILCVFCYSMLLPAPSEADTLLFLLIQRPHFGPIFWIVLEMVFASLPNINQYLLVSDI